MAIKKMIMASEISDKAVVSPKAKIGEGCKIFPFVYIEDDVEIGDNCVIFPFVSVLNGTRMGNGNKIHQGTVLAALPQDFAFKGDCTQVVIGNDNIIRENVVINRATHGCGQTVIGNGNFLMEGVHVSHDTKIGDKNVFGYGTKIAGDCVIGNQTIFSSSVIENAGTRVGDMAMIQAGTTFSKDVPPYIVAGGTPVGYGGPNNRIMELNNVGEKQREHVANAYRLVFHGQVNVFDALLQIKEQVPDGPEIQNIRTFIKGTKKGIISIM